MAPPAVSMGIPQDYWPKLPNMEVVSRLEKKWEHAFAKIAEKADVAALQPCVRLGAQIDLLADELLAAAEAIGVALPDLRLLLHGELWATRHDQPEHSRYDFEHFNSDPSEVYNVGVEVGAGAFGTVCQATHIITGQNHALKRCQKASLPTSELWAEIEIMKQLDHPHILRLFSTFETDTAIYMASEMCFGGSFHAMLQKHGVIGETASSRLFRQVVSVISYLHSINISHRDIKPENFLIHHETELLHSHLKLIDFGSAKRFDTQPLVTKVCTPLYVAPEVLLKASTPYTEKVDVWSCGVMLFRFLYGSFPFSGKDDIAVLRAVKKGQITFPEGKRSEISEGGRQLIIGMMCYDVKERFTATEAFHHSWISQRKTSLLTDDDGKKLVQQISRYLMCSKLKRIALNIIARIIDDDLIDKLRGIFLQLDEENTGMLHIQDMKSSFRQLHVPNKQKTQMIEIIGLLDQDGHGYVRYTDFLAATMTEDQYLHEDVCKAAFHRLDTDHDGVITRKDLAILLADDVRIHEAGLIGLNLVDMVNEVDRICADAAKDAAGGIHFEDFMNVMKSERCLNLFSGRDPGRRRKDQFESREELSDFEDNEDAKSVCD
eukprot:TRINITY_DN28276_c1_g1_i1.p1 TRINITY_DN28276_c1_g1~~TRINITY_DN28276_c1_g1_i1.p1  ORF type:complete len:642 (+),score=156.45 TRINITY_DN28276_c1_g1_i1:113-1927(+)